MNVPAVVTILATQFPPVDENNQWKYPIICLYNCFMISSVMVFEKQLNTPESFSVVSQCDIMPCLNIISVETKYKFMIIMTLKL